MTRRARQQNTTNSSCKPTGNNETFTELVEVIDECNNKATTSLVNTTAITKPNKTTTPVVKEAEVVAECATFVAPPKNKTYKLKSNSYHSPRRSMRQRKPIKRS